MRLSFMRVDPRAQSPSRAHPHDAGYDLYSIADARLDPGARVAVPTGIAVAVPPGHAGLVLPRSGLALRHGISVVNAPGLIDPGYRGEIKVLLLNTDREAPYEVRRGDRIAQIVVVRASEVEWHETDRLDDTPRGGGGFGSSGRE